MESLKESYFFAQYKKEFGDKSVTEPSKLLFFPKFLSYWMRQIVCH